MNIEIANRLRQMRNKNNLSQEELAAKMGVSRQAVSKWERAEASPDTENLILLAKLYGVSIDELLAAEHVSKPSSSGISLKKDDYGGQSEPIREAVPENYTEKEIYPGGQVNESTSIPQGSPFGADIEEDEKKASGSFGETVEKAGLAIGDILNSAGKKIEDGVRKASAANGKDWEAGVESFCDGLNRGIDKAGRAIERSIDKLEKKIEEKDSKNNYNYSYSYSSTGSKSANKSKKTKKASGSGRPMTLLDKTLPIFVTGFFFLTCTIGLAHPGWTVFLLIPLYYTGKEALRKRNPMIFCYPVLCAFVYFTIGGFLDHLWNGAAEAWYSLMWLLFLTIPLYYTIYPAIKKRNPLIFCYPVLCVIVYIGMGILLNEIWWWAGERWFAFMWAPIGLTIPLYYIVLSHYRNQKKASAGNQSTAGN